MIEESLWPTFRGLADSIGDNKAILSPGREPLRFVHLAERMQCVRDALAQYGIGPGDRVVTVLPGGPETAVCFLAIAACATYIPLNPDSSEAEFTTCLVKLRPKLVIVPEGGGHCARHCAGMLGIGVIDLVTNLTAPAGTFSLVPRLSLPLGNSKATDWNASGDIALVLLTSGSTAEPKAVPRKVRHVLAYAHSVGERFGHGPHDRGQHTMPLFHGHGLVGALLVPLANGGGVICAPEFNIPSFFQQMKTLHPTWYSAAPSIHRAILASIDDYRDIVRNVKLRFIRSGASRLDPKIIAGLESAFSAPVMERYGTSETGTVTANYLPPGLRKPGTVGTPVGNEVAVIDANGHVLGPNCEGEIVARGPGVFDGYLDDPAANEAAFINGWFRTGDVGRFDDDGYLTITGRIKQLINRGGEKISTAEIETQLSKHPAVAEVCVFGIPHPSLGEDIAAAVSLSGTATEQELRAYARCVLTGNKVPRRIFVLASLPKSRTHKIDRGETTKICLDLIRSQDADKNESRRKLSSLERQIAKIWKRLLRLDAVDADDDFFLLGGNFSKRMK